MISPTPNIAEYRASEDTSLMTNIDKVIQNCIYPKLKDIAPHINKNGESKTEIVSILQQLEKDIKGGILELLKIHTMKCNVQLKQKMAHDGIKNLAFLQSIETYVHTIKNGGERSSQEAPLSLTNTNKNMRSEKKNNGIQSI